MDGFWAALTAILPMLGVVLGIFLQHRLSRAGEQRKQSETLRDQAYADYLHAVAELGAAHLHGAETQDLSGQVIAAKTRIAIYGTTSVVEALAKFEAEGAVLKAARDSRFLALCEAMRADSAVDQPPVRRSALGRVLFGSKADE